MDKYMKICEKRPKRDLWALTGPYRPDMLEIMRLERVKDQKLMDAKKHMESFEMMKKRRAAGSLGREMNECDFDRAEKKHFTEAKRLQEEANDVEANIDMIENRVQALREQLRKDERKIKMFDQFSK